MNKYFMSVCVSFLGVLLVSSGASADKTGPEGEPPIKPFEYTCDAYMSDVKMDSDAANKKAYKTIEMSLNYVSDGVAYRLYQQFVREKKLFRPLAETLKVHREFEVKTELLKKLISETAEKKGTTEFILQGCIRKNANINEIAYAFSVAYDQADKSGFNNK